MDELVRPVILAAPFADGIGHAARGVRDGIDEGPGLRARRLGDQVAEEVADDLADEGADTWDGNRKAADRRTDGTGDRFLLCVCRQQQFADLGADEIQRCRLDRRRQVGRQIDRLLALRDQGGLSRCIRHGERVLNHCGNEGARDREERFGCKALHPQLLEELGHAEIRQGRDAGCRQIAGEAVDFGNRAEVDRRRARLGRTARELDELLERDGGHGGDGDLRQYVIGCDQRTELRAEDAGYLSYRIDLIVRLGVRIGVWYYGYDLLINDIAVGVLQGEKRPRWCHRAT